MYSPTNKEAERLIDLRSSETTPTLTSTYNAATPEFLSTSAVIDQRHHSVSRVTKTLSSTNHTVPPAGSTLRPEPSYRLNTFREVLEAFPSNFKADSEPLIEFFQNPQPSLRRLVSYIVAYASEIASNTVPKHLEYPKPTALFESVMSWASKRHSNLVKAIEQALTQSWARLNLTLPNVAGFKPTLSSFWRRSPPKPKSYIQVVQGAVEGWTTAVLDYLEPLWIFGPLIHRARWYWRWGWWFFFVHETVIVVTMAVFALLFPILVAIWLVRLWLPPYPQSSSRDLWKIVASWWLQGRGHQTQVSAEPKNIKDVKTETLQA
ncbi:uncharacterized protein KY384_002853 [Bacidia gigantensis]|uniref:uncharacterized protein n=1 Tax=Bacidia gigantensis TaxID=2732470 RepID=UPI001D053145|nr:uncharacterized protein KY384_002853 [Bacidia gigantensis]KAG8532368.1 hypothetical protein KY384_002853 [Bacidia gigantensis]